MFDYSRLEDLRKSKGITQKFIAEKIDRKPSIFQAWRDDKSKPSKEQLAVVAQILDTSPAYLLGETDIKTSATKNGDGKKSDVEELSAYMNLMFDQLTFENQVRVTAELQSLLRQQLTQGGQKESD